MYDCDWAIQQDFDMWLKEYVGLSHTDTFFGNLPTIQTFCDMSMTCHWHFQLRFWMLIKRFKRFLQMMINTSIYIQESHKRKSLWQVLVLYLFLTGHNSKYWLDRSTSLPSILPVLESQGYHHLWNLKSDYWDYVVTMWSEKRIYDCLFLTGMICLHSWQISKQIF